MARQRGSQSGSGETPLDLDNKRQDAARLSDKRRDAASTFSPERLVWLYLICDQLATSPAIEPENFEHAPFSQQGEVRKAHGFFGSNWATGSKELNQQRVA